MNEELNTKEAEVTEEVAETGLTIVTDTADDYEEAELDEDIAGSAAIAIGVGALAVVGVVTVSKKVYSAAKKAWIKFRDKRKKDEPAEVEEETEPEPAEKQKAKKG